MDPKIDKWSAEIAEAFLNVLRRPKFGFEVGELKWEFVNHGKAEIIENGDKFLFTISVNPRGAVVELETDWRETLVRGKFRFVQKFDRVKTQKVRQKALICAEKLKAKGTYDVLNM
jgi:hypothetical protein